MMLGEEVPRSSRFEWKTPLFLFMLMGCAALVTVSLPHALYKEEPVVAMVTAPSATQRSMQPPRAWQPPRAQGFMQPTRARQPVQPVSALSEPDYDTYPVTRAETEAQ